MLFVVVSPPDPVYALCEKQTILFLVAKVTYAGKGQSVLSRRRCDSRFQCLPDFILIVTLSFELECAKSIWLRSGTLSNAHIALILFGKTSPIYSRNGCQGNGGALGESCFEFFVR